MITVYKNNMVPIDWEIFKGTSNVREDFTRALLKVFIVGCNNKYYITDVDIDNGMLKFAIPEGLHEGAYSLEAIWVKNWHPFTLKRGCEKMPHDINFTHESLMHAKKDFVFSITEYPEEQNIESNARIHVKSSVATYGYDGLGSYELAVMRGLTTLCESEWVANLSEMNERIDEACDEAHKSAEYAKMRGDEAKSAYELACDKGFVGTLEDYLKYLHGIDGVIYYPELVIDKGMHLNLYKMGIPSPDQFSLGKDGHLYLNMIQEDRYNEQLKYNRNINR